MIALVENKRDEIQRLCKEHRVRRLELFGSAATGSFDPAASDLDFLVDFQDLDPGQHADTYFGLLEELERLFDRRVDLVMLSAIENPFFLDAIRPTRALLYAA